MEQPENITGGKILELLELLKRERTILKLTVLGTGNEGLTILLGTKTVNEHPCLIIDFPAGTHFDILYAQGKKVIIEFSDKNKINYSLKSVIEWVSLQNIYVLMPKYISRIQRRKFFRVPPPIDTKVIIREKNGRYEFNVIDISEGGALISHPSAFHDDRKFFKNAQKSLVIVYEEDGNINKIKVNRAEIKRIEKILDTGCYNYAFQFIDCGKQEENDIRNFVYSCQRIFLKNRQLHEENMF